MHKIDLGFWYEWFLEYYVLPIYVRVSLNSIYHKINFGMVIFPSASSFLYSEKLEELSTKVFPDLVDLE